MKLEFVNGNLSLVSSPNGLEGAVNVSIEAEDDNLVFCIFGALSTNEETAVTYEISRGEALYLLNFIKSFLKE